MRVQSSSLHPFRFIRRHWLVLVVIIVLSGASYALIQWFSNTIHAKVDAINAETARQIAEIDAEIEVIEARKAEEERLRKLAAAKKASEEVVQNPQTAPERIDPADCNVSNVRDDPSQIDVLVNKKHCIQPLRFAPTDLQTRYGATISAKAMPSFVELYEAARAAGRTLSVTSSYRSYDTQVATYNYWVSISGVAGADTYSARPGYSEHQTGLAIDFANATGTCSLDCFGSTPEYQWLLENAHNYGFIQRYYAGQEALTGYGAEEWHWRYVGVETATAMKERDILTLEVFWDMPGGFY